MARIGIGRAQGRAAEIYGVPFAWGSLPLDAFDALMRGLGPWGVLLLFGLAFWILALLPAVAQPSSAVAAASASESAPPDSATSTSGLPSSDAIRPPGKQT